MQVTTRLENIANCFSLIHFYPETQNTKSADTEPIHSHWLLISNSKIFYKKYLNSKKILSLRVNMSVNIGTE